MKYNLSAIMKRAWEIKKEDKRNIFSLCLKKAWAEAKNRSFAERLIEAGGELWERYGKSRIYIPEELGCRIIDLEVEYYKSGNVMWAYLGNEEISHKKASDWLYAIAGIYYDNADGCFHWKEHKNESRAIARAFREKLAA